ncbi:WecB/TagA/CpsF family glycosyltransferase [Intestinimonas butyriciproducens]|uniref:WecB/TagA/CpsF family glycosyltransferase n=1 Tax=Intestinimonas butyriciproducens TaxID=1297617 RepID=UPI00195CCF14|nr:WecB/TagA/CpsF family glycosyltransferase [Intestinimonas butyriciproducens]MBM6977657.1 WecB/TagA/CpsF family glycosyltransferase [Intestinimonas butyriciproducens]
MRTEIMGVGFDDLTLDEAAQRAAGMIDEGGFHYVVTPNPELVDRARREEPFRQALNGADLVLPDGIGVVYAARLLGRRLKGRCPGIDFAGKLMEHMARTGLRLYLLGAKPGVAEAAAARLEIRYPGLTICGTHDGYFQEDAPVVEEIRRAGADVVFVCLGAPKQEYWMVKNGPATGARLMAGLGGSLDVFAGVVERAPESWQRLGLEWLYRLTKEPKRIGRMARLPLFLVSAVGERGKAGKGI